MKKYKWQAVMDDKTCAECATMHGHEISESELKQGLCPPLHGDDLDGDTRQLGCRCTLVPVTEKKFITNQ